MNHTRKTVKKRKKKKRLRRLFLLVFLLLLGGVGAFGYNIYSETKQASSKIYQALDPSGKPARNIEMRKDPFTVLLVGVENQYHDEEGRSDVVMLLTVNPKTNKVYLLSIPRDTRVYIPSEGRKDKITHSYSHGGIQSTIAAVNELIDVPIDYYVTTDFDGFQKIVDSLGGVTVDVPFTFKAQLTGSLKWHTFHKGKQELNGNEALAYVRMRKSDPRGDFGRNERQKQVIRAIIDKSTSITSLPKLDDVIADLGDHVRTNIPPSDLLSFIYVYQKMKNADVENLHLKGYDETINGVYYYIPDEQSVSSINETLRQALETSNASLTRSDSPSTQSQN
ncbi:transcriptional regulator [Geobacillus thermoleovorans]|uniref:LCP family protein n=1 Tax=Geobacillus thermoleovorans TaxID=33941 RepID=UPI00078D804D|nr:transcriptional regulator [Geobacillus thermoleovorans]